MILHYVIISYIVVIDLFIVLKKIKYKSPSIL